MRSTLSVGLLVPLLGLAPPLATVASAQERPPVKVMMLNAQDQQRFVRVLDAAVKAQGVQILQDAHALLDTYLSAGTLTDQRPVTDAPKEEPK